MPKKEQIELKETISELICREFFDRLKKNPASKFADWINQGINESARDFKSIKIQKYTTGNGSAFRIELCDANGNMLQAMGANQRSAVNANDIPIYKILNDFIEYQKQEQQKLNHPKPQQPPQAAQPRQQQSSQPQTSSQVPGVAKPAGPVIRSPVAPTAGAPHRRITSFPAESTSTHTFPEPANAKAGVRSGILNSVIDKSSSELKTWVMSMTNLPVFLDYLNTQMRDNAAVLDQNQKVKIQGLVKLVADVIKAKSSSQQQAAAVSSGDLPRNKMKPHDSSNKHAGSLSDVLPKGANPSSTPRFKR